MSHFEKYATDNADECRYERRIEQADDGEMANG